MRIRIFALGPLQTNGYLLSHGSEAVFVDPGGDPAEVLDVLRDEKLTLTHILITHLHFDHVYGAAKLARETGAPILVGNGDAHLKDMEIGSGGAMGLPKVEPFEFSAIEVGETEFLGAKCVVILTPGHTPGGLTYYFPDAEAAFVGDSIFAGAVGRTDFPGGSMPTLLRAVEKGIFTLPENTELYPGHGPSTKVREEKLHNPFFQPGAPGVEF